MDEKLVVEITREELRVIEGALSTALRVRSDREVLHDLGVVRERVRDWSFGVNVTVEGA